MVSACGVCRTDLHVVDAELPGIKYPVVPGHEIVGRVDLVGGNVTTHRIGDRVGIPWLGYTCGVCRFCKEGMENLCDRPLFTGYTRDGGFATHTIADARYAFPLGEDGDDVSIAPLLCAGLIGWRSLVMAGSAERLGIYGFGAAGHIVAQVARWEGRFHGFLPRHRTGSASAIVDGPRGQPQASTMVFARSNMPTASIFRSTITFACCGIVRLSAWTVHSTTPRASPSLPNSTSHSKISSPVRCRHIWHVKAPFCTGRPVGQSTYRNSSGFGGSGRRN
jgi:hypothetical protein